MLLPFENAEREPRLGRLRARLSVLPGLGEWACLIERPGGEVLVAERLPLEGAMDAGDFLFQLRIIGNKSSRVRAVLHRLEIAGVLLHEGRSHARGDADAAAEAAAEVARRRVEGDRLGSLAALAVLPSPSPSDRLLEVALLAELGRWGEARLRLAALFGGGSGASSAAAAGSEFSAIERDLFSLLRLEPALYSGLLRDVVGPAEQRRIFVQAWYWVMGMNASVANCVAVERGLAEVDRAEDPFEVLLIHATASKCRGRLTAAEASYRAALGAFDKPRLGTTASSPAVSSIWRIGIMIDLLELAVAMGEPARAEAMLRDLLNGANGGPEPDLALIDGVLAHPELRSLRRSAAAAEKMSLGTD